MVERATPAQPRDLVDADRLGGRLTEPLLEGVEDALTGRLGGVGPQALLVLPGHRLDVTDFT